jgi:hypothetical protein
MTDARIPERWLADRRLLRLSDSAYRTFITMLVWSVANRSDGVLDDADLDLLPGPLAVDDKTMQMLVDADLLLVETDQPKRWRVAEYAATQTSRHELEVLESVRRRERQKKARQRAAAAADKVASVPGTVPGDDAGGSSPGTAQDRQDRLGALRDEPTTNEFGIGKCAVCAHLEKLGDDGTCAKCFVDATAASLRPVRAVR